MTNNNWKYTVRNSVANWWVSLLGFLIFCGIAVWMYIKNIMLFFFPGFLAAVMLFAIVYGIYNKLFKKILIDEKGFYYQTSPSNAKYFAFTDISKAWMSDGNGYGNSVNYFGFETSEGDIYKFNITAVDNGDGIYHILKEVNGEDWRDDKYDDE